LVNQLYDFALFNFFALRYLISLRYLVWASKMKKKVEKLQIFSAVRA